MRNGQFIGLLTASGLVFSDISLCFPAGSEQMKESLWGRRAELGIVSMLRRNDYTSTTTRCDENRKQVRVTFNVPPCQIELSACVLRQLILLHLIMKGLIMNAQ